MVKYRRVVLTLASFCGLFSRIFQFQHFFHIYCVRYVIRLIETVEFETKKRKISLSVLETHFSLQNQKILCSIRGTSESKPKTFFLAMILSFFAKKYFQLDLWVSVSAGAVAVALLASVHGRVHLVLCSNTTVAQSGPIFAQMQIRPKEKTTRFKVRPLLSLQGQWPACLDRDFPTRIKTEYFSHDKIHSCLRKVSASANPAN